ncbi:hypothetical protein SDC9_193331 [bioreactor metagenome]|uniref:Uncharacterized protein n=1 Tax=bioreactor metagenome TaxID=1076179 RepID=A0A645I3R1_9ZZZZ
MNDVARDKFFAFYNGQFAVAQHFGGGRGHGFECFDGLFGFAFLHHTEHRIQDDDK